MVNRSVREVVIGNKIMGGSNPILVQTMWDRAISDYLKLEKEAIVDLAERGCDILRFALLNNDVVPLLGELSKISPIPLVADVHFDYRLALQIMDYPIAKIRINPGNIGDSWKVEEVVRKAADKGVALRVGANEGSLPKDLINHKNPALAMVLAAEKQLEILEKLNFSNLVVSLKSSSVDRTIEANRLFRKNHDIPLHLGVTEAGPLIPSLVKSTLALGTLLKEGIGETLRISISDSPEKEIQACRELLAQLKLDKRPHVEIISCPKCGRTGFDTHAFMEGIEDRLQKIEKEVSLAVMGCEVNGPGEARKADLGITGSGNRVMLFRHGKVIRTEPIERAEEAFWEELEKL